jgi:predicted nucleic acid-binding protein
VLETSFWTVGHRADVLPYLFDFFEVCVPPAVRDEILAADPAHPRRVYGYAALYRLLESVGLLPIEAVASPLDRFGRGEAEALALAGEQGRWLLINDAHPFAYARQRGIETLSVPAFIGYLYERDILSLRSVEAKMELIRPLTGPHILRPAQRHIDRVRRSRKERE